MSPGSQDSNRISLPDQNAAGLIRGRVDALRYDVQVLDPDEISGIVASFIPNGSRVLDIGCGTGLLGQILSRRCRAGIIAIEPDPVRVQRNGART